MAMSHASPEPSMAMSQGRSGTIHCHVKDPVQTIVMSQVRSDAYHDNVPGRARTYHSNV